MRVVCCYSYPVCAERFFSIFSFSYTLLHCIGSLYRPVRDNCDLEKSLFRRILLSDSSVVLFGYACFTRQHGYRCNKSNVETPLFAGMSQFRIANDNAVFRLHCIQSRSAVAMVRRHTPVHSNVVEFAEMFPIWYHFAY